MIGLNPGDPSEAISVPDVQINENARLELLRTLAGWRDLLPKLRETLPDIAEEQALDGHSHPPAWANPWVDIVTAARECEGLGHVRLSRWGHPTEWSIAITDAGYAWIKARDVIGEITQEPR